jgi:replication fork protection complex subunit Csm3/Swi3
VARLLSQAGIPKLRRSAKEKLRFKGKGHEYTDAARLLNFYQLWLDDLYPRAKFSDGLAIIEKLGHLKRMQVMRKEWIDEGKPKRHAEEEEVSRPIERKQESAQPQGEEGPASMDMDQTEAMDGGRVMEEEERQAEVSHTNGTAAEGPVEPTGYKSIFGGGGGGGSETKSRGNELFVSDDEEEDDLEALLTEQAAKPNLNRTGNTNKLDEQNERDTLHDNFDDDMEAMAEFDHPW